MSDAVPEFGDWLAIANLKARYCRMLDTKDWPGYAALLTEDVVFDATGSGGPRMEGRDAVVTRIRQSLEEARTVHQVHSPEIEIARDGASAIWALQDRIRWPDGRKLSGAGHYHELYVRQDGEWRIAESRLTRLWLEMTPEGI
jgi:uncharacterized protein (TIGR02246 family)